MLNIDELIKDSLKTQDKISLRVYRNLKTEIIAFKTQKNAPEYTQEAELSILRKYHARMEDAEKQYFQAGREDLAQECREDLEVLQKWLPKPVNVQDIYAALSGWCVKSGCVDTENCTLLIPKKSMGLAIKAVKEVLPTADGKLISETVKKYLV